MDDDDLRRGRPTCHKAFGEDVAILAGDALYAEAFTLVLTQQTGEPAHVLKAAARLAQATGVDGMVGGQYIDVKDAMGEGIDGLRGLHALKTGQLIAASVECVLLACGAPDDQLAAYSAFAQ
jgi:geranylgeranyl diphosphate synthase type II